MGLIKAFGGAIGGTFSDQWKEIVTAGHFDEHTVVVPGMLQQVNNGRGTNINGSNGVLSNGSKILYLKIQRHLSFLNRVLMKLLPNLEDMNSNQAKRVFLIKTVLVLRCFRK